MGVLFANRLKTTLSAAATAGATSFTLSNVASLPAIGGGNYCYLTLTSADQTVMEVVKATAVAGSVVTVTRAQEGTTAAAWGLGTPVELRLTTQSLLDALADRLGVHATADAALKLATPRTFLITGDMAWSVNFDGTADVTGAGTIAAKAVTNSKLADMAVAGFKGASAAGAVVDIDAATARNILSITNVENKSSATIRGEITSTNVTTALGFTPEQAGVAMPKTGGTFTGAITVNSTITATGQIFANSNIIVGSNAGGGNNLYLNGASATFRGIGFQTAGAYAGDISLQTNNTTIAYKSIGIHSFQISGTEAFQVNGTGATVTGALAVSGGITSNGGTVATIGGDGGMEVGTYLDMHSPTADGVDYRARISADAAGTLYLDPTADIVNVWATSLYLGAGVQNLLVQHDSSNGYIRTNTGKGNLSLGANGVTTFFLTSGGDVGLPVNSKSLFFTDVSGTNPKFICQTDNNFVFYGTGAAGAARPIFGIVMRSDTSALAINVDTTFQSGTVNVRGTTMMALTHDGGNGYIQAKTGMLVLGANGNNSIWCNTDGSVTTGVSWNASGTWNFTATNQMVLKNGTASNPSIIFRNDGSTFYVLKSAASTAPSGAWDTTRPFSMDLATGNISMSQSLTVSGTLTVTGTLAANDITTSRGDGTGVIFLGGGSHYVYWNGSNYIMPGGPVVANGLTLASQVTAIVAVAATVTVSDAAHLGNYNKLTTSAITLTFGSTPSTGFGAVFVNRSGGNITLACAGGYYKNGAAATATANLTLASGGKVWAFHEGGGVWTLDGTGF